MTKLQSRFQIWIGSIRDIMDANESNTFAVTRDDLDSLEQAWRVSEFSLEQSWRNELFYGMTKEACCSFCKVAFGESEKDRPVARSDTLLALESHMCLSVRNMFERDSTLLRVITSLAGDRESRLCSYCHTRATVSREAAEAL